MSKYVEQACAYVQVYCYQIYRRGKYCYQFYFQVAAVATWGKKLISNPGLGWGIVLIFTGYMILTN